MGKRRIAILGSTGSIGTQALRVIDNHRNLFEVELLTAYNNSSLLIRQAIDFDANAVVIGNPDLYKEVSAALDPHGIKVFAGNNSISQILSSSDNIDLVLTAMVGFSGVEPTVAAIKSGKAIALANKETMVAAGAIVSSLAKKHNSVIIPVDSEHSAIFQCLQGECSPIKKLLLTASGGPFLRTPVSEMKNVTRENALNHPRWNMGAKVTIDSASMMNKGFEMIEAKWLFNVEPKNIEIVIHPQSVIHSMVLFQDGSVMGQMSNPDMMLPIQFAFCYPHRLPSGVADPDFIKLGGFTFSEPDTNKFPCIPLAYHAINKGGNAPCIMNAANEIAVSAFLDGRIGFCSIPTIIEKTLEKCQFLSAPSLDDIFQSNKEGREYAKELINKQ